MIGIHQVEIDKHHSCYFVERPFGNYLFFPDFMTSKNDDFFISKSGIYKLYLESNTHINDLHGHLFTKFGASAVIHSQSELFHEKLPIERAGIDFDDVSIQFQSHGSCKWIVFTQKEQKVFIMGNDFNLKSDNRIFQNEEDKTDHWLDIFIEKKVNFIFFCHFEKSGHLETKSKSLFSKVISFFK